MAEIDSKLELLTDDIILDYSREGNRDNILFDHRDLNLKYGSKTGGYIHPYQGGVYDACFGSPIEDECICGKTRRKPSDGDKSLPPCPHCGYEVLSREEGLRRFARIELGFYYLNDLRLDIFKDFLEEVFRGCRIDLDFIENDLKTEKYGSKGGLRRLNMKAFDSCQFTFNKADNELKVSQVITDDALCSYEGIMKIIQENFPGKLEEYKKLINRYYLVLPSRLRPFTFANKGGRKKTTVSHEMTLWYQIIIHLMCPADIEAGNDGYTEVMKRFKTPGERVRYTALLRALINKGKKKSTNLLNTSKENLARNAYAVRTKNSARCPIIPSTTLAIDEVAVPKHLAYEMCRSGFIKYLQEKLNFTYEEAKKSTKTEYENPKIQELFKEYAEQQYVVKKIGRSFNCYVR